MAQLHYMPLIAEHTLKELLSFVIIGHLDLYCHENKLTLKLIMTIINKY
ncbi:MAG TPA: hypothetical protein PLL26_05820 [Candidatus Dojkabacteria bacterium]|nr:hypothetical protein [Candidatus Dojkabacteria bacterium]